MRYILGILLAECLLLLISFVTAGFAIRSMGFPLGFWSILALLYGVWRLAGSQPEDNSAAAVRAMRGQAGANPLANYASRQEYKLTRLREEQIAEEASIDQDGQSTEEHMRAAARKDMDRWAATCVMFAGLLALVMSWLLGRMFSS